MLSIYFPYYLHQVVSKNHCPKPKKNYFQLNNNLSVIIVRVTNHDTFKHASTTLENYVAMVDIVTLKFGPENSFQGGDIVIYLI